MNSINNKMSKKCELSDNVCRGCLFVSPIKLPPVNDAILNAFTEMFGINISKESRLPNKICSNCLRSVKQSLEFKTKCLLSDRILSALLKATLNSNGQFDLNDLRNARRKHPEYRSQVLGFSKTLSVNCIKKTLIDQPRTYTNAIEYPEQTTDPLGELDNAASENSLAGYNSEVVRPYEIGTAYSNPENVFDEMSDNFNLKDSLKVHENVSGLNNLVSNLSDEEYSKPERVIKNEFDAIDTELEQSYDNLDEISVSSSIKEEVLDDIKVMHKKKKKKQDKSHDIKIERDTFKRAKRKTPKEDKSVVKLENLLGKKSDVCDKIEETVKKDRRIYYRYDDDSVNVLMLNAEEQIRELKEIRKSKQYIEAPFKCESCAKYFSYELSWKGHLVKHEESSGKSVCSICLQRFSSSRNLQRHSSGHEKRLECKQCGKVLHATTSMAQHIAKHNGTSHTYICGVCDFTSVSNSSHRRHIITHTNELKRYKCPYCPKAFNHCTTRNDHAIRAHTGQKNFACQVCKMTFVNKTALKSHSITHSERKDFYCVECDKRFKTHSSLANHLNLTSSHGNPAYLKFPCGQCDKRYDSALKLKAHVDCTHLYIFKWACDKCSARFRSPGGIKKHRERYHEGKIMPKIHPCETCGRVFASKAILRIHFRIHTGERPYVCKICDRPFRQEAAMRTHVKLVHLKLKRPFKSKKDNNTETDNGADESETNLMQAGALIDSALV